MNPAETEFALNLWAAAMREMDTQTDALSLLVGNDPEAALPDAIYRLQAQYTKHLAELLGFGEDTLLDWWLSHNFGEKPLVATIENKSYRVTDSAGMAEFICDWRGVEL